MVTRNPKDPVFYVYALIDPRDGLAFYIGKGKGDRCRHHVRDWLSGKGKNDRKSRRIGSISKAGFEVQISIVADGLTEYQAYKRERAEIAAARKCREITNLAPGMRTETERNLDKVNYNLSRFRSPDQYKYALLRENKRLPTAEEWDLYFDSLSWFADLKEQLTKELGEDGPSNSVQA